MNSSEKEPCIQKRIKMRLAKILSKIFFNPVSLFVFCVIVFSPFTLLYIGYLEALNDSHISDLVNLVVTTDGFIIAFTGVIASLILKHVWEEEKEMKGINLAVSTKDEIVDLIRDYKKKRLKIIGFVSFILFILTSSIFLSLSVIMTQKRFLAILSIVCLFVGLIELITMLYYSLH